MQVFGLKWEVIASPHCVSFIYVYVQMNKVNKIHFLFVFFVTQQNFSSTLFSERATSSSLPSEDWELNMEICDLINSSEEGCVCFICQHQKHARPPEVTCLWLLKTLWLQP